MPVYTRDPMLYATYVDSAYPDTVYDDTAFLNVEYDSDKGSQQWIFFEDNIGLVIPTGAHIRAESKVEFYVTALVGSGDDYAIRPVGDFDETTLTFNTVPIQYVPIHEFTGPTGINAWFSITGQGFADVVQYCIDEPGIFGGWLHAMIFGAPVEGNVQWTAQDDETGPNEPRLTIYYDLPRSQGYVIG